MTETAKKASLLSKQFVILNVASFLAQINMAVFFQLHQYLLTLPIDHGYVGFLIGIFSVAGIIVQPVLSPFVNERNARPILVSGVFVTICALLAYRWAFSFQAILAVRIFHGLGFVLFVTAMNSALVSFIPVSRAGQAFGLVSINMLVPLALVPALLGWLNLGPGRFVDTLAVTAMLMVPTALLCMFVLGGRKPGVGRTGSQPTAIWREVRENLADARIIVLLATTFLTLLAYTPVFFLYKEFAEGRGVRNAGTFFSVATGMMIMIRLIGGRLFDSLNRALGLILALTLLSLGYALLVFTSPAAYLFLAVILGAGWGFNMPFLNSLLFECSRPTARALNVNLSMVLLQAAYFVGPIIGTAILRTAGYSPVFLYCAAMILIGACLNLVIVRRYATGYPERTGL